MQQARQKGTRFLLVIDGPDELKRLMSPQGLKEAVTYARDLSARSRELRVTTAAGTDFVAKFGELKTVCQYGYAEEPGCVDTWGPASSLRWTVACRHTQLGIIRSEGHRSASSIIR
jgi:2,5-dihydroxypyridine 5,6-dioxygenase